MSIGGTLFSFYMKINRLSQFSFSLSQFLLCTRAPAVNKFNLNFFCGTSNDNTNTCDVHRWYTFFVSYVN